MFFRSIFESEQEHEQKILSASLLFHQISDESQMSNLLRKDVVNGRLGKFQVVPFPDKFKGLLFIHYCLGFINLFICLHSISFQ